MPRKSKLFIASSSEARILAEALDNYVTDHRDPVETFLWCQPSTISTGHSTLDALLKHSGQCDFVAAILTTDDLVTMRTNEYQKPRDNVIFELGLFMGALGQDPGRCFMVCAVEANALPSDLRGIVYVPIDQPDLTDREACEKAIAPAGSRILAAIQKRAFYERPRLAVFPSSALGEKERSLEKKGDLLIRPDEIAVVVNSVEPVEETDTQFAGNVMENLRAGARYEYFWGNFEDNHYKTANFIQALSLAGISDKLQEDPILAMKAKLMEVRSNLFCMQKRLSIHFRKRPPLQFCVHNARSEHAAACYLRHDSGFVRWADGRAAKEIAKELTDSCKTKAQGESIFHSTVDFRLTKVNGVDGNDPKLKLRRRALMELIQERFPAELHGELEGICFGR
jgi:hypothetical protein